MRGHIKQKPNGSWRLVVSTGKVGGKYRQATKTVKGSREQADRELRKLIREAEAGQLRRQETVGDLLDAWLPRLSLARRTRADYARVIETYLRPAFGDWKVETLRAVDLDQLYDSLTVGPARVRRVHTVISGALQQAVKWQWIAINPALHASPPPVPASDIVLPPAKAVGKMLELAAAEMTAFIRLGVTTGARAGELCALRWTDLDFKKRTIRFARAVEEVKGYLGVKETKTGKVRTIADTAATFRTLKAHRTRSQESALAWGVEWSEDSYVFRTWPEDKPWRPNIASQRFSALRDEAGFSGFTVHSLRHQMATTLLSEGVDPATIAGRGGWANAATFLRYYAHFVPAKDKDAAELLGKLLG